MPAPRRGDHVPVLVRAGDGPVVVYHTPDEYATLMGAEPELALLLEGACTMGADCCGCDEETCEC